MFSLPHSLTGLSAGDVCHSDSKTTSFPGFSPTRPYGWWVGENLGNKVDSRSLKNTLVLKGHSQLLSHADLCNLKSVPPKIKYTMNTSTASILHIVFHSISMFYWKPVPEYSFIHTCIIITFALKQYELCILWYENQLKNGI